MKIVKSELDKMIEEQVSAAFKASDRAAQSRYSGPDSHNFYGTLLNLIKYGSFKDGAHSEDIAFALSKAIKDSMVDNPELLTALYDALYKVSEDWSKKVYK